MGEESGGGGNAGNARVRGQVGLTKKEQNARAIAQEQGGRQSSGVAGPSTRAGARESGFASSASKAAETSFDSFTTSTEGAYRDLNRRATEGQFPEGSRVRNVPVVGAIAGVANEFGKKVATKIQDEIKGGGIPVYDEIGRIVGVEHKNSMGFSVYTGGNQYNPRDSGARVQKGIGYVQASQGAFGNFNMSPNQGSARQGTARAGGSVVVGSGGGDGGSSTSTAATATNVTGSTTQLSTAARRRSVQALGGGGGAGNRRNFIG